MPIPWNERVRTLWIGNLPHWADEGYLCLCFYHFNSTPPTLPGKNVKIIRNPETGRSCGYGFMTFETREVAERILCLYNGLKIMPGTMNRFCLNWASYRFEGRISQYKNSVSIRSLKHQSNTPLQLVNNTKRIPDSSNLSLFTIADLPIDVIENIFLRLPVKSIVRCRVTCKAWAYLTSASRFIYWHLKNQSSLLDPIVAAESTIEQCNTSLSSNNSMEADCTFRAMNFEFPYGCYPALTHSIIPSPNTDQPNIGNGVSAISNTCNGLMCVYRSESTKDNVCVVNPSIQETIQLPKSFSFTEGSEHQIFSSMGIGYDDCSDTYKIVRMLEKQKTDHIFTGANYEVITLGGATCHWRPQGHVPYHVATDRPPIFLHGTIYWPMSTTFSKSLTDVVISFNVSTETVCIFPVPEANRCNRLFVLEECLWIFCEYKHGEGPGNLYVLEDYINCKWVKKHTIEHSPVDLYKTLIANRDGKIFFTSIPHVPYWTARHYLFYELYYDTKSASFKKMATVLRRPQRSLVRCNIIRGCAESLVSPILYLQRSNTPCPIFHILGRRWATLFPANPIRSGNRICYHKKLWQDAAISH